MCEQTLVEYKCGHVEPGKATACVEEARSISEKEGERLAGLKGFPAPLREWCPAIEFFVGSNHPSGAIRLEGMEELEVDGNRGGEGAAEVVGDPERGGNIQSRNGDMVLEKGRAPESYVVTREVRMGDLDEQSETDTPSE
ncbi:hypothetical protein EG329_007805 [Mollisiaceae sp. DMI_Dod_QoI]|nr:hypothetical protein EG329_007805 [Helotiales sp. DMI_Dod_QoI]